MLPKNLTLEYSRQKHLFHILDSSPAATLCRDFPFYASGSSILISTWPTTLTTSRGLSSRGKNSAEGDATRSSGGLPNALATVGSTTTVGISVPPLALYKNRLFPRNKIAGFFDEDARGFFA